MTSCHRHFLDNWDVNKKTIEEKVSGSWSVCCAHCLETMGGSIKRDSESYTTVLWTSAKSWFGSFIEINGRLGRISAPSGVSK